MTTRDMTAEEHEEAARIFVEQSSREFAAGDVLQGSEKLWGAAAHAVISIALRRDWPVGSHRNLVDAIRLLAEERDDDSLKAGFSVARKFHDRFYGRGHFDPFAEAGGMDWDREVVEDHVRKLLAISSEKANGTE